LFPRCIFDKLRGIEVQQTWQGLCSRESRPPKAKRRKLEKKMLQSQRKSDKDGYREICNKYTKLLHDCKHLYYTEQINQCAGDSRKLFQVFTLLCNKKQECPLPPQNDSETLANDFGDFFCRKIDLLREEIDSIHMVPPQINCYPSEILLHSFSTVTESDVRAVIMSSSSASGSHSHMAAEVMH